MINRDNKGGLRSRFTRWIPPPEKLLSKGFPLPLAPEETVIIHTGARLAPRMTNGEWYLTQSRIVFVTRNAMMPAPQVEIDLQSIVAIRPLSRSERLIGGLFYLFQGGFVIEEESGAVWQFHVLMAERSRRELMLAWAGRSQGAT